MGFLPLKYEVSALRAVLEAEPQYESIDRAAADGLSWAVGLGFESKPDHDERDIIL